MLNHQNLSSSNVLSPAAPFEHEAAKLNRRATDGNGIEGNVVSLRKPLVSRRRIPIIGIVGGIGSGKSAVTNWVAARSRVAVINADALGHDALNTDSVIDALTSRFGNQILGSDGTIVRSRLAELIFGMDPDHLIARRDLEDIVHPEISRRIMDAVETAAVQGQDAVLLDAAILLEAGWRTKCDLVVYIDSPDAERLNRVRENRGWTLEELNRREGSQWSLTDKRRESDFIVTNDRELEYAGRQLLNALQQVGVRPFNRLD